MGKFEFHDPTTLSTNITITSFDKNSTKLVEVIDNNGSADKSEEEKPTLPKWVEDLSALGQLGERLALKYLREIYKDVQWVSDNARLGYDILADEYMFEIKTTLGNADSFFISKNELVTANRNEEMYRLLFICVNEKTIYGYIFQNIYSLLGVSFNELIEKSSIASRDECAVIAINYQVVLSDEALKEAEKVDLISYFEEM